MANNIDYNYKTVFLLQSSIVALKKITDSLGHYLYMTIGIIWSLAAKGRLILKKDLYFGKQTK